MNCLVPHSGFLLSPLFFLLLFVYDASASTISIANYASDNNAIVDPYNCSQYCTGPPTSLNTSVPNVLLLSDSIGAHATGYYDNVRALLGPGDAELGGGALGNAQVQHTGAYGRGICGTSFGVVACADMWLGAGNWSVIHFNWGLVS